MIPLDPQVRQEAVAVLRAGGIVAAATETLVALLVDAHQHRAVDALFALKKRPENLPIALLAPNFSAVEALIHLSPSAMAMARAYWPGPLTVIGRPRQEMHPGLSADGGMGVRIPGDSAAAQILAAFAAPLTATSANRTGEAAVAHTQALAPDFATDVRAAGLIVSSQGRGGRPSTLIDIRDGIRVLRKGSIQLTD